MSATPARSQRPLLCDWASCTSPSVKHTGGWDHCAAHLAEHYALEGGESTCEACGATINRRVGARAVRYCQKKCWQRAYNARRQPKVRSGGTPVGDDVAARVLRLVEDGTPVRAIAQELKISTRTVQRIRNRAAA